MDLSNSHASLDHDLVTQLLLARGVPHEFIKLATDKLAAINTAYEKIQRERGLRPE